MAETKKYTVKHKLLLHDRKRYLRGQTVQLTQKDALPLLAKGIITTENLVPPPIILGPSTLAKLTVAELLAHGEAIGVALDPAANKEALLAAFAASAAAAPAFEPIAQPNRE